MFARSNVPLFALPLILALSPVATGAEIPKTGFPQSAGIQLKTHNFTTKTLDHLHKVGFRVIRRGFYWSTIEKKKGAYDFSKYDEQMKHAQRLGLTVVGVLFGNNKLYEDDGQGGIQTEAGRQGFARFAAALAEHYKDHNVLWEVWNEPNVSTFWRRNGKHNSRMFASEYTALVKAVAPAMLKANPNCFVMAGSVSNYWEPSYQWTEGCFKNGILKTGIRGWSVHPYGVKTPEEFGIGHARTRSLLKKYGAAKMPILNSERGFAVKQTREGWSGGSKARAREFQAWHLVRQFMIDQMHRVALTVWYEWDGKAFGISDEGGSRPAYKACQVMFEQMSGYEFVRRIESDSELDYVLLFRHRSGERKLVAWTAPLPGGAPDEAIVHPVSLELVKTPSVEIVDLEGKKSKRPIDITLTLSGAPKYIALPNGFEVAKCASLARMLLASSSAMPTNIDLKLFDAGVPWKFLENTGSGFFKLAKDKDGDSIAVMHYDFTESEAKSRPYVLAAAPVSIVAGTRELRIRARSPIRQQLTFRVVDSTGQTHQFRGKLSGTRDWETIRFPLNRRLEHWDGANDGKIHFPVKQIVFSVPLPKEGKKAGDVEYDSVIAVASPKQTISTNSAKAPTGPAPDKLFESAARWKFLDNTGSGSFSLGKDDGKAIGVLRYDFTKSKSKSRPYVLAVSPVQIRKSAQEVLIKARSPIPQQLTFRLVDSTGQTHQVKKMIKGKSSWQTIRIPLTKRLEHWGGAKDGKIHFPITSIVFSVPLPDDRHKIGQVEYADVSVKNRSK